MWHTARYMRNYVTEDLWLAYLNLWQTHPIVALVATLVVAYLGYKVSVLALRPLARSQSWQPATVYTPPRFEDQPPACPPGCPCPRSRRATPSVMDVIPPAPVGLPGR